MQTTVDGKVLSKAVREVYGAISARQSLPVLAQLLYQANEEEQQVTLAATDLEVAITVTVPARVTAAGVSTIPARALRDALTGVGKQQVGVATNGAPDVSDVTVGTRTVKLTGFSAEEFPVLPTLEKAKVVTCDFGALRAAIQQVECAASRDETRALLTGVLLEVRDGVLYLVATNSYRVHVAPVGPVSGKLPNAYAYCPKCSCHRDKANLCPTCGGALERHTELLVPARALRLLARQKLESPVTIRASENQVTFDLPGYHLASRVIEGQYPNYRRTIPKADLAAGWAYFDRVEALTCFRRLAPVAAPEAGKVTFRYRPDEGGFALSCGGDEFGRAEDFLGARIRGDWESKEFAFQVDYLRDAFNACPNAEVRFSMEAPLRAGLFEAYPEVGPTATIMPMQIL